MSAISKESVGQEVTGVEVSETEDGLVEMCAVSETKGTPLGFSYDGGGGFQPN
jgi:hypothetical protein